MSIPRPEYPRPHFKRQNWINLNGSWSYAFDHGRSGAERGFGRATGFDDEIIVPFCPESRLSGVEYIDFIPAIWYHREIEIPPEWNGLSVWLHFGAVDYRCEVYLDGVRVGRHTGGSVSWACDLTGAAVPGNRHHLVVLAEDDVRSGVQPAGKQSVAYYSQRCNYTRVTGIWQTVWLEAVDRRGLRGCRTVIDLDRDNKAATVLIFPDVVSGCSDAEVSATLRAGDTVVASTTRRLVRGMPLALEISHPRLWSPEDPFLYDLDYSVVSDGEVVDHVHSYVGIRSVEVAANRVLLNGEPRYLRLVLDQGFYPDGIWTAPSEEALKHDIELGLEAGFNGARLHQKVFEPRFHYWADRLGYLTWGESASWGLDLTSPVAARNFLSEWREIVERDRNHPSIIAWSPFNETSTGAGNAEHRRVHLDATALTREIDPTRPVNDASGYIHYDTDLFTVHNYEQDPDRLSQQLDPAREGGVFRNHPEFDAEYRGEPYIVDEFGGIKWDPDTQGNAIDSNRRESWGYGEPPSNLEEFHRRLKGQVDAILSRDHIAGYCYTQLTDVEQEQNGIYRYDRSEKFEMKRIQRIFSRDPDSW